MTRKARFSLRRLLLATAIIAVGAWIIFCEPYKEPKFRRTALRAFNARVASIKAELADTNVDWGGDYYAGDGLGSNESLALAPEAGWAYRLWALG